MKIKLSTGRLIGDDCPAYIIAEIGINHNGSIAIAKKLIDAAAFYEIDAVKFQKRTINELWTKSFLDQPYTHIFSFGETYGEHKRNLEFSEDQFLELKAYAASRNIDFLVSGFDYTGLDFINNVLDVPIHKIPSPYVTHYPFLKKVAEYGKPIILSTGMHTMQEVIEGVNYIKQFNDQLIVLQCTSTYPIENEQADLKVMQTYRKELDTLVGYSSHDKGIILPVAAVVLGACVIEKHFTFDRTAKGPDHAASVQSRGLELIHSYVRIIESGIGDGLKKLYPEEEKMRIKYGISVVSKEYMPKGTILTPEKITFKIPGGGISPKYFEKYIGKSVTRDIPEDEIIFEQDVE